jgi:hypothetical protein
VLLAAAITLVASKLRPPWRLIAAALLGAWVVAVGTGRTMAMQRDWNASIYANQRRTLRQLTYIAPQFEPHTFVVLRCTPDLDVRLLVRQGDRLPLRGQGAARCHGADSLLYGTRYEPTGVVRSARPSCAGRGAKRRSFTATKLVVFLEHENGVLSVLDSWPEDLGPLPTGQVYSPRSRIRVDLPPPKRLAILDAKP